MADLKLRNELGLNRTLAVLEPSRKCVGRCTWCYVELNRKQQAAGKQRRDDDPGTFESLVEKAFGPHYDPTDLLQWGLRNKVPFVYSSGVEPFQDLAKARAILQVIRSLKLPVFFQTRGTNWREVWDLIEPMAGNVGFYVSIPSLDARYIKRFEPKTPTLVEREALVRACKAAGIPVMAACAPYHPQWCASIPDLVRTVHEWGATDFFFDRLHLNDRQKESLLQVGGDKILIELEKTAWSVDAAEDLWDASDLCAELGMGFEAVNNDAATHGITPFPSLDPWPFKDATKWPYIEEAFLSELVDLYEDDPNGPILVDWPTALAAMERDGSVDQPFSMRSLGDLMVVKSLAPAWLKALGKAAPMRDYLRAMWNTPRNSGFPWHHPFIRYAVRPDGTPWRGEDGDLVMAYHPHWAGKSLARTFESLDDLRWLTIEE